MATKKEVQQRIIEALAKKVGEREMRCSLCGDKNWLLTPEFHSISLSKSPKKTVLGGQGLPVVPLTCNTCGNTHMLNLIVLGFEDLGSLSIDENGDK